jgi:hypothetical protein
VTPVDSAVNHSIARCVGAIYSTGSLMLINTSMANNTAIERVGAIQVAGGALHISGGMMPDDLPTAD